jgi:hypothetical protein
MMMDDGTLLGPLAMAGVRSVSYILYLIYQQ